MKATHVRHRTLRDELWGLAAAAIVAWFVIAVRDVGVPWVKSGDEGLLTLGAFVLIGLPIAFIVCGLLGAMAFQFLDRRNLREWWHATLAGALVGLAVFGIAFATAIYPQLLSSLYWQMPLDLIAGALAGTAAWLCAKWSAAVRAGG